MTMRAPLIVSTKLLRRLVRMAGGHGSALPGLIVEHLDKRFLAHTLSGLPHGVAIITGTNGKTTTTHMLVQLLRRNGLKVLTNASGSNLTRGLISTVIEHSTYSGKLPYDIAVFELDEAFAPVFTRQVSPRILLALNVMRDQLDRYGEIDTTATLIAKAARQAGTIIINGNDTLLAEKTKEHSSRLTFGLTPSLRGEVSSEANLYAKKTEISTPEAYSAEIVDFKTTDSVSKFVAVCRGKKITATIPLLGVHNTLNAIAAILTTKFILPDKDTQAIADGLKDFKAAFGRGETVKIGERELTVALIKNPSGFTQNVRTFVTKNIDAVCIVINDEYADGRDVSWLWDSQIDQLKKFAGIIFVGGKRRYDMALRLKYEGIAYKVVNEEQAGKMMQHVLGSESWSQHLLVIPTYTAMLSIRKWLGAQQGVKHIW